MIWILRGGSVQGLILRLSMDTVVDFCSEMGKRTLVKNLNKSKIKASKEFCGKDIVGFFAQL